MAGAAHQQTAAVLRLQSDLKAIQTEPPDGCSASPHSDENLFVWSATIFGPDETAWEGESPSAAPFPKTPPPPPHRRPPRPPIGPSCYPRGRRDRPPRAVEHAPTAPSRTRPRFPRPRPSRQRDHRETPTAAAGFEATRGRSHQTAGRDAASIQSRKTQLCGLSFSASFVAAFPP